MGYSMSPEQALNSIAPASNVSVILSTGVVISKSKRIHDRVKYLYPGSPAIKVLLDDCDMLISTLRLLSSEIIDMRETSWNTIRAVKKLLKENPQYVDYGHKYHIDDSQHDNISWHAQFGILTVRDYFNFREPLSYFDETTYAELIWLHESMISVATLLRKTGLYILGNYTDNLQYVTNANMYNESLKPNGE